MKELLEYQKNIAMIQYTINILRWELNVSTPKKSEDNLIELITYHNDRLFQLQTSSTYGDLLKNAINEEQFKSLDEAEQRYVYNLLKDYNKNKKIPCDFYTEYEELINRTTLIWKEAKEKNDYEMYKPHLSKMIDMTKQYYKYISYNSNNLYDVMLNEYEMGITSNTIDKLFSELKTRILPLIPTEQIQINSSPKIEYSESELFDCAKYVLEYIGFDMDKGQLGIYPHGYTQKICQNDVRITFRKTNDPLSFLLTIIHEGGHGIFEQNISKNLSKYENDLVHNLYGLHESQSRFCENILGRNINFWIPIYNEISNKLRLNISLDEFISILNISTPSLIRTDADELTYCMHIILRYEIERDLFNDKITVDDLPEVWNKKMKDYLNIDVDTYSNGLMQDVHWSEGAFGYFPSYLLGTIYDGMFLEAVEKELGNIDELLKSGQIKKITNYLINNIYKNGGAYSSIEVINKMCGKEISVDAIVKYFENKYGQNI